MISKTHPLWDPISTLQMINPSTHTQTCIGYAPSQGRRCRNAIRVDNRAFIADVCDEMSYMQPDSPGVLKRLRKIAGPALCVRWHQGQADEVLRDWKRKLTDLVEESDESDSDDNDDSESEESEIEEVKPARKARSGRSGGSKKRGGVKERSLSDAEEDLRKFKELYEEMRERLDREKREREKREKKDAEVSQLLSAFIKDRREDERQGQRKREEEEKRKERVRMEQERLEKERLEKERLQKERLEKERLERERLEKERLKKERQEKERLEKERQEKERLEKERLEKEEKKRQDQERNERIRQRAQKRREEAERLAREKAQQEAAYWDSAWKNYQSQWTAFKACPSNSIPWPLKTGDEKTASNVRKFYEKAAPKDKDMAKMAKRECLKWHEGCLMSVQRLRELSDAERLVVEMICRVLTGLIDESAGKEAGLF